MNSETTAAINAALNLANVFISNSLEKQTLKLLVPSPRRLLFSADGLGHTSNKIYDGKVRRTI